MRRRRDLRFRSVAGARALTLAVALIGGLLLSACKTLSPDAGMDTVADIAGEALQADVQAIRTPEQAAAARAKVEQLLRRPLTVRAAVQVALLNNRGLQADYNELGIAEAAMVEASLPPSPTFSLQRISGSVELEIERRIVGDILALATLPARSEIAGDRFRQAQLHAAEATLRAAAETRRAYYRSIAAVETVGFLEQATATAKTADELAKRLGESGAMNKLDQAREQVLYAEIAAQLAKARQQAAGERERLVRAMGLSGRDLTFRIPGSLPALPARPRSAPTVEMQAVARRLDLQIARIELDALAKSLGLTQATRFLNLLELSGVGKTTLDRPTGTRIIERGFEAQLQIPLFDFGATRVRAAEETYMQAVNRLAGMAVNARSQAREAYQAYRSSYDTAAHYRNEVLPLRKLISDEMVLRYNAMMIDVFALLTEARQRVASTITGVEAERDFWLATIDLDAAILGGGVSPPAEGSAAARATDRAEGH
ncbi:MAG TPA: TolC family protein [Xanthobacteraceae bacterium]|jgi:outer membrane protein TolC